MHRFAAFAILLTSLAVPLAAADEPLPAPTPVPETPPLLLNPQWGRMNRYAVWQNYAVDLQGRFRPRVIYTPDGAFYTIDGRPYPWMTVHPLNVMPYAGD